METSLSGQAAQATKPHSALAGRVRAASWAAWLLGGLTLVSTAATALGALPGGLVQLRAEMASPVGRLALGLLLVTMAAAVLYCLAGYLMAKARRGGVVLALVLSGGYLLTHAAALAVGAWPMALAQALMLVMALRAWRGTAPPKRG